MAGLITNIAVAILLGTSCPPSQCHSQSVTSSQSGSAVNSRWTSYELSYPRTKCIGILRILYILISRPRARASVSMRPHSDICSLARFVIGALSLGHRLQIVSIREGDSTSQPYEMGYHAPFTSLHGRHAGAKGVSSRPQRSIRTVSGIVRTSSLQLNAPRKIHTSTEGIHTITCSSRLFSLVLSRSFSPSSSAEVGESHGLSCLAPLKLYWVMLVSLTDPSNQPSLLLDPHWSLLAHCLTSCQKYRMTILQLTAT